MGDVHVISTADVLCGSHAFQHNFQPFVLKRGAHCRKFLVSLESPARYSVLHALGTSKSLIGAEYTEAFRRPPSENSRGLSSGDRIGRMTGPSRPLHCSPEIWFRRCVTVPKKWRGAHHAWTTRAVFAEEVHVPTVLVNHSLKMMVHCKSCSVRLDNLP
jgi:hypothetical protein